jgi:hypothetical protein
MRTQIIQVPYDSGYKDYRMGRGPAHIVRHPRSYRMRSRPLVAPFFSVTCCLALACDGIPERATAL